MFWGAARVAVRGWWAARRGLLDTIPRPLDEPRAWVDGPDPIRVLVIGNGPASGFGVASHTLALPGHLARQLAALTKRGVSLQLITDTSLTIANAARFLAREGENGYDLVISTIGSPDAVYLTPVVEWRRHLGDLLDRIREASPLAGVLVVGVPPTSALRLVPGVAAAAIDSRAAELDAASRALARRPRTAFLPFSPPAEPDRERHRSSATYAAWSAIIAPHAAGLLADATVERAVAERAPVAR